MYTDSLKGASNTRASGIIKSNGHINHLHSGAGVRTKLEGAEYAIFRSRALTDLSGGITSPPARGLSVELCTLSIKKER